MKIRLNVRSIITSIIICSVLAFLLASPVVAQTIPSYPSCLNPQGTVKVSYSEGTHGIVGRSGEYKGSDTVYTLNDNQVAQCFCANDGKGIQTNWLKADGMSEAEIQVLKNQGWVYIPNGALWGLSNTPYVAYNTDYSCKGDSTGVGGASDSSGNILGRAFDSIQELAGTGNIATIYALLTAGIASLLVGVIIKRYGQSR